MGEVELLALHRRRNTGDHRIGLLWEAAMRNTIAILPGLCLGALITSAPVLATNMKATAPEKMLSGSDAAKMRACEDRARRENIPMDQKAAFVQKCMAEMK